MSHLQVFTHAAFMQADETPMPPSRTLEDLPKPWVSWCFFSVSSCRWCCGWGPFNVDFFHLLGSTHLLTIMEAEDPGPTFHCHDCFREVYFVWLLDSKSSKRGWFIRNETRRVTCGGHRQVVLSFDRTGKTCTTGRVLLETRSSIELYMQLYIL